MSNDKQASGNAGGCVGSLLAVVLLAVLLGAGLWAYGYEPREAVGLGLAGAGSLCIAVPATCVALLGVGAAAFIVAILLDVKNVR